MMLRMLSSCASRIHAEHGFGKARFFVMKYLQFLPHSENWLRYIHDMYQHHCDTSPPIEMLRSKFMRRYYARQVGVAKRLNLLTSHYDVIETYFRPQIIRALLNSEDITLAELSGKSGTSYHVTIRQHDRFRAEGELTLLLHRTHDAQMLAALTFSLGATDRKDIVVRIGGLQGPRADNAKEMIVQATRDLHGARPKSILVDVVYTMASMLEVKQIEAVSLANHPLNNAGHALLANNDAFFLECGAGQSPTGNFSLPLTQPLKSIEDVPGKKRKDWLAKQALRQRLCVSIEIEFRSWLRYASFTKEMHSEVFAIAAE